ncbi:MAG: FAD:protein FMN transferase [Pirellulaceae bacterium]|nr:FAD:protein FMN transferase [Pirellulaceae bacterium]
MAEPTKTTRREFLRGKSAAEALADAVIGQPQALDSPAAAGRESFLLSISRDAMACQFEVLLPGDSTAAEGAVAALDLVERLEAQLTVYRDNSEIMAINRRAATEPIPVEAALFDLLQRSVELFEQTGGAFDITSGPLSKVWGFYRRQGALPAPDEIAAALANVGSQHLQLDRARRTIRFGRPGMELNLGAIGKGHALDCAAAELLSAGAENFVIHGGNSSVLARGGRGISEGGFQKADLPTMPAGGFQQSEISNLKSSISPTWSVALRHPLRPEIRLAEFFLINQALGTSGSGTQFFHHQGRRYGHILDPRTGWPAQQVLSATVIAPTAEQADALSTAFYVLGNEPAAEYCRAHPEISALLVTAPRAGAIELHPVNLADAAWRRLTE